ncbi:ATP-grasp domain-containing protein [uncultured Kordia sp.]|uniref:ATP-grasp domain-containing protein n=1 Tax=uncultured Kordia sp. TaxID=507699 RepID=UPI0026255517|nr:ATP-grasp domain-containing protein [uncultured Kordia sp.]
MNTQKIIVISPNFSEDSMIISQATINSEFTAMRFGSWNVPLEYQNDVVAVYGEDLFTTIVAEQCNLKLLKPADDWLASIPLKYTLRNIIYDRFGNIYDVKNKFIKPVDFKFFPAGVYTSVDKIQGFETIDNNIEVFVSDVVNWSIEVRCFVIDRNIQTWSTYIYNKEIQLKDSMLQNEETQMLIFLNEFLTDKTIDLPKAVVIDVGYIPDKGWALIEANPVWSSGVYACNPKKVIDTIVKSCEKMTS